MTAYDRQRNMLATIFSFFLGLMVLAFIGVGVNTALPDPMQDYSYPQDAKTQGLYEKLSNAEKAASEDGTITVAEQARIDELNAQIRVAEMKSQAEMEAQNKRQEELREDWTRKTSITLIIFATIVMGISLVQSEKLRLISNGLLLGGLFTMLYGTGWSIFSGDDWIRFGVIAFALVVTVGLGYAKFVRSRAASAEAAAVAVAGSPGVALDDAALGSLAARVARLEARAAAAAAALGADEPKPED
ncbi:MAG: hypothetical protein FDZ70_02535 [Actinobacteria bacterium]|nr:MAG: hypothetical protein FDZ70_02535 [Actinomycetota bacterium]